MMEEAASVLIFKSIVNDTKFSDYVKCEIHKEESSNATSEIFFLSSSFFLWNGNSR